MNAAGATFAVAVVGVVAVGVFVGVWVKVSWRGRRPAAVGSGSVPGSTPAPAPGLRPGYAAMVARVVGVGALAAGVSAVAAMVMLGGDVVGGGRPSTGASIAAGVALVAVAAAVATLGIPARLEHVAAVVALVAGTAPSLVIGWTALYLQADQDAFWAFAGAFYTGITAVAAASGWALATAARWGSRQLAGSLGRVGDRRCRGRWARR